MRQWLRYGTLAEKWAMYCTVCGSQGKLPCDHGCTAGLLLKDGLCTTSCGHETNNPCDGGKCVAPLQVINGKCKTCGLQSTPPCPLGGCKSPHKIRRGLSQNCGSVNTLPCDAGCDIGLLLRQGVSSKYLWYGRVRAMRQRLSRWPDREQRRTMY